MCTGMSLTSRDIGREAHQAEADTVQEANELPNDDVI